VQLLTLSRKNDISINSSTVGNDTFWENKKVCYIIKKVILTETYFILLGVCFQGIKGKAVDVMPKGHMGEWRFICTFNLGSEQG
jgi:hypothetical protein